MRWGAAMLAMMGASPALSAETCRYAGAAGGGPVAVHTVVSRAGPLTTVDATLSLTTSHWLYDVRYLAEEISVWRGGALERVAVNTRYSVDDGIKRQQWDVFERGPAGLEGRRVQARRYADFRAKHPGFAGHWPIESFGRPWLAEYDRAPPERRADLDLAGPPAGVRTPLALAFWWTRALPAAGMMAPVFLPGFKRDALVTLSIAPAGGGEFWRLYRAPIAHPALSSRTPSSASAWVSRDGQLLQLAFDLQASFGSAQGLLRREGCAGTVD